METMGGFWVLQHDVGCRFKHKTLRWDSPPPSARRNKAFWEPATPLMRDRTRWQPSISPEFPQREKKNNTWLIDVRCRTQIHLRLLLSGKTDDSEEDAELVWKCVSGSRLQTRLQRRKFGRDGNLRLEERKTKNKKRPWGLTAPRNRREGDKAGKQQTSVTRRHCVKNTTSDWSLCQSRVNQYSQLNSEFPQSTIIQGYK